MTVVRLKTRAWAPVGLIVVVVLLVGWTIANQLQINSANRRQARQAHNGQLALNRQCRLLPVSKKLYVDELQRHKITAEDFALVLSTAAAVCPTAPQP